MDAAQIENFKGTESPADDMGLDDFIDHVRGLARPACPVCGTSEAGDDGGACAGCTPKGRDPLGIHNFWRNIADRLGI